MFLGFVLRASHWMQGALVSDRAACLAAGMDDYLATPFTRASLGAVVSRRAQRPG